MSYSLKTKTLGLLGNVVDPKIPQREEQTQSVDFRAPSRIVLKAKTRIESREKGEGVHRVNIPQTLSLLPENQKAGKKCWAFQVCTSRWRGKAQRTLPPLQGRGALKNDPTA